MLQTLMRSNVILKCSSLALSQCRTLSLSSVKHVKEIVVINEGKNKIIEGVILESPRTNSLLNIHSSQTHSCESTDACSVCRLDLDIKHTDVLILSQFLRADGCMLPRRITGLCRLQQKRMSKMVTMAQKAGLMPNLAPANSKRDPARRDKYKKNHRYYDERTIRPPVKLRYPSPE